MRAWRACTNLRVRAGSLGRVTRPLPVVAVGMLGDRRN